ncbi:hypothetical protein GQ600_26839 [Phytophthora cactorum]|nr:hypothetical protein GQ600_26839 [Phytophthora cactorum]
MSGPSLLSPKITRPSCRPLARASTCIGKTAARLEWLASQAPTSAQQALKRGTSRRRGWSSRTSAIPSRELIRQRFRPPETSTYWSSPCVYCGQFPSAISYASAMIAGEKSHESGSYSKITGSTVAGQ